MKYQCIQLRYEKRCLDITEHLVGYILWIFFISMYTISPRKYTKLERVNANSDEVEHFPYFHNQLHFENKLENSFIGERLCVRQFFSLGIM